MHFDHSDKVKHLQRKLEGFMDAYVYPNEQRFEAWLSSQPNRWDEQWPLLDDLQQQARAQGLWNLFLPDAEHGAGLSNLEYAPLCEIMGRSLIAPEVFNCSAPDTGNMELLHRYGTRGAEEAVARAAARGRDPLRLRHDRARRGLERCHQHRLRIERDGDDYVINGQKWWITGAPLCALQGLHRHGRRPTPTRPATSSSPRSWCRRDTPGVTLVRSLTVFGYDDAPARPRRAAASRTCACPRATCSSARAAASRSPRAASDPGASITACALIGTGRAGARAHVQAREGRASPSAGPSREQTVTLERIAESRIDIEQARLLVFKAAYLMDTVGNKVARKEIAMIKVAGPAMALRVLDRAIQAFGAGGLSADFPLAAFFADSRTLRFADGPDEVHRNQIGRLELREH